MKLTAMKKYGRLIIVGETTRNGRQAYVCRCDCGKLTTVLAYNLIRGVTKSCGCLKSEVARAKVWKATQASSSHGLSSHPLYGLWKGIMARCYNENRKEYPAYGGRGIKVEDEWHDFQTFYDWAKAAGWSPGMTLDKMDNDRNYGPDNCQWLSRRDNVLKQWDDSRRKRPDP